jgi:SAM-dependent methyltransferase
MNAEPFMPLKESLALIENCILDICADVPQINDWFMEYAQAHKTRIAFDYDLLKAYCAADSTIVEVASVPLLLTLPLKKMGYKVIGVDVHPERFQTTINKFELDVRRCDIEHEPLPFPGNFCDIVLFNEIFEHLRINLIFTMREVFRIIKPGGLLLLSTPNLRSLTGIKNFLFRKRSQSGYWEIYDQYEKLEKLGHMGHVREYTSVEVYAFLRKIGFNIESLIYRGTYRSRMDNCITKLRPNLRPFISYVARKPC